jgi:hypothetical protein
MERIIEIINILLPGSAIAKIRTVAGMTVLILMAIQYVRNKKQRKKITEEEENKILEETFEKNEDGLYPWEVDTDDSPKSIPKDAKRVQNSWGPQRGKW